MVSEIIATGRLVLRPVRSSDVDDVLEYASDLEWSRYLIALPSSSCTPPDARNIRSLRVMDKLGMKREALLRSDRFFRGELVDEARFSSP